MKLTHSLFTFYHKFISPIFGFGCCRYSPTCSHYTHQAIQRHGLAKGVFLGTKRLLSCHPYSRKEYDDPVPKSFAWRDLFGYNRREE